MVGRRIAIVALVLLSVGCAPSVPTSSTRTATASTEVEGHQVAVSVPGASSVTVSVADRESVPEPVSGVTLPLGALDIDIHAVAPGSVATVTVTLDTAVDAVRKLVNGRWDPFGFDGTTGAEVSGDGKVLTLHLQDGGRGDADGVANGRIADPIAPAEVDPDLYALDWGPTAIPGASTFGGLGPLTVQFSAIGRFGRASFDPDDDELHFSWDFGDGTSSSDPEPLHVYVDDGVYQPYLTVSDDLGRFDRNRFGPVEVGPPPPTTTDPDVTTSTVGATTTTAVPETTSTTAAPAPTSTTTTPETTTSVPSTTTPGVVVAVAEASPVMGVLPLFVSFSSAGSASTSGTIVAYEWDFGDGTTTSNLSSPVHYFAEPGVFSVTLTVTDDEGRTDTASVVVTVLLQ